MTKARLNVTCRPARAEDTPEVMELTSTIWEGEDYVPHVWQDWLADTHGVLAVAEYGGHVLGLGKLTRLAAGGSGTASGSSAASGSRTAGQWWLEGLRTHPEYEGRGVATHLHTYLVDAWLRKGGGTLRLATASFRKAVQHLCDQTGFIKVGEFSPYHAASQPGNGQNFTALEESQAGPALENLRTSPTLALCSGLIDLGWEWCTPLPNHLVESARQGKAFWWRTDQGLIIWREDQDDESGEALMHLKALACQVEDLAVLLSDCRHLADGLGYQSLKWTAPLQPAATDALEKAGYVRSWDASVYIYAREHPSQTQQQS
ncbi:MAG: GNAT family N-acetyltransferase [Anaerolineales bacterium]